MNQIAISCFFLVMLFSCGTEKERQKDLTESASTIQSEAIPTTFLGKIKLNDLNGQPVDMDQYQGKILLLNLWATWCRPCIAEMPDLIEMEQSLSDDFVLIAASDEDLTKINRFLEKRPFALNILQLETSMDQLGVYSLPTTLVIGREGELLETLVGAHEWNSPEQLNQLNNYLQ